MHRILTTLCLLASLLLVTAQATATLADYSFEVSSGSAVDMDEATTLWEGSPGSRGSYDWSVAGVDLPFTFRFDGVGYDQVSINPNGVMSFGTGDVTSGGYNSLSGASTYPMICPFWDQMTLTGGSRDRCSGKAPVVRWGVSGTAPNRVFIVRWQDLEVTWGWGNYSTFEARLYESTNIIDFYYDEMTAESCVWGGTGYTSGTIGIASSPSDFITVIPDYGSAYIARDWTYDWIDLGWYPFGINSGTIYRFAPCNVGFTGTVASGGTAGMRAGDTLMSSIEVQRGSTEGFEPFSIDNFVGGCGPRNFTIELGGVHASDYMLSTTEGYLGSGESITPTIYFSPTASGTRYATLTITDDNYFSRTFTLAAKAGTRIEWIPDLAEGGTADLADGDTLMKGLIIPRRTPRDLTPMTLRNFNTNEEAPAAIINISIDSAGEASTQYELVGPTTASLAAGESFTPVIRFTGEGVGPQEATLTVVADEETRVYTLYAISGAPAIEMRVNGVIANAENPALNLVTKCVGDVTAAPLVITNTGTLPLTITGFDAYLTDTTYQQGTPLLKLLRDARGNVVPVQDYTISVTPGGAAVPLPFTVEAGQSIQYYLTFIGSEPGKRWGRMFLRTNAENLFGEDTTAYDNVTTFPNMVLGLLTADMTARAFGSQLASNTEGLKLKPIVFPHTPVGDTSFMSFPIANAGACDLRINRNKLRVFSGDVNEFKMMASLRNATLDAATGDFVLTPGMVDTITVRFTPSRAGTRMATLWIQTNDSTIKHPGLSERGAYYLDMHGRGQAGLDGADLVLDPVVIGNSVNGEAVLENTLNVAVGVSRIYFDGGDAAEFSALNWPATPHNVLPASKLRLGVTMTPAAGSMPGMRRTTIVLITNSGDTVRVGVRGEAGTQTLVVSPTSMFDDLTLYIGQARQQSLVISNTGTLPVRITSAVISGPDSASYRLGMLPRLDLDPGQTDYVDVTFAPSAPGQTSAQIDLTASNGQTYTVMLGGNALKIRRDPTDPTRTEAPFKDGDPERRHDDGTTTKGRPTLR
jgi:hypothetical protein